MEPWYEDLGLVLCVLLVLSVAGSAVMYVLRPKDTDTEEE